MRLLTLLNQWITNETPQPNANERQRTCAEMPNVAELSGAVTALITAWLEVRVLPGPPHNKINDLGRCLATLATYIGDRLKSVFFISMTIFAGSGRSILYDLRYLAKTMECAWPRVSIISIGFITLLTLRRIGRHRPSDEAGASFEPNRVESRRSINLVKGDATFDLGRP